MVLTMSFVVLRFKEDNAKFMKMPYMYEMRCLMPSNYVWLIKTDQRIATAIECKYDINLHMICFFLNVQKRCVK